jgi:hypothetical protein
LSPYDQASPFRGEVRVDALSVSLLHRFLAAADLDDLAAIREELLGAELDTDDRLEVTAVLHDWDDIQAVANLLMHPQLIPADERAPSVQRGLGDVEHSYLRLAACVGVGELDLAELDDDTRHRLVQTLLDAVATDAGTIAERASFSVIWLLRPTDAPEVVECLTHPSSRVRHNLAQGLLGLLDSSGLGALISEPGFVPAELQARALQQLESDGIDLSTPAEGQRKPLVLAYVPNYVDWTG